MKLIVTVLEETFDAALAAIRALADADHDGIELRAEKLADVDLRALRAATSKLLILTHRGLNVDDATIERAVEAGIDLVDVEWRPGVAPPHRDRVLLSHHDYARIENVEAIAGTMKVLGCAVTKIAATPRNFPENERLLRVSAGAVIGMGERGLYSRILAPFRGSQLTFVTAAEAAAPGMLSLERALAIYGPDRAKLKADRVFTIVGNPAGHSLSPSIHNPLFREKGVSAAYTIASISRFEEITEAFLRGEPCGISVTAPFKEDAYSFAERIGASIGEYAHRARAVNTLVNVGNGVIADNTDVDGFMEIIPQVRNAAIIGAGGTARAAQVALEIRGIESNVYNRTVGKGARPLAELRNFGGELVINTLPPGVDVALPKCDVYVEAIYGRPLRAVEANRTVDGLALLYAQARRQHELFMRVFDAR